MFFNLLKSSRRCFSTYRKLDSYIQTNKNIEKALTIRPDSYYNDDFFKIEKEQIFKKSWVAVGYTNELEKNNIIKSKVHDIPIIITSNKNGEIKGFYNVCRHRGCELVKKSHRRPVIMCPYHRWTYTLDGDLKGVPLYKPDKEVFDKKDYSLYPIKTEVRNNIIFANLDNNMETNVNDYYKDAFKILDNYPLKKCKIVKEKTYNINANWKLLIDNFIEYYHLPGVHPKLVKNSGMDEHVCTQEEGMYVGFKTDPLTSSGEVIDVNTNKKFTGILKEDENAAHFQMLFPNIFYFLFPNHLFSVIIEPVSPTKSIEKAVLMVEDDSDEEWINNLWKFYDEVNIEDLEICEAVQEGIKCDIYNGGRMVPKYENTIHRFHKMVIDKMVS
jgi:choline monooxygenase